MTKWAKKLSDNFPELRSKYIALMEDWGIEGKPGQHVIYGEILNPYIDKLLEERDSDKKLEDIFCFLERLSNSEEERIQEVVVVTVLEHFDKESLEKVRAFMGPTTLRFLSVMEDWGRGETMGFRDVLRLFFSRFD